MLALIPKNRKLLAISISFVLVALILLLNAQSEGVLARLGERIEAIGYDMRMRWDINQYPREKDELVVIVNIDEKSLRDHGHWPWPRTKVAQLIETL